MNREQAMDKAVKIIDEQCKVPMKSNGYALDGWKAPSLEEKVDAIIKLADFLWQPDVDVAVYDKDLATEDNDA